MGGPTGEGWGWRRGSHGAESFGRQIPDNVARAAIGRLRTIPVMFGERPDRDQPAGRPGPARPPSRRPRFRRDACLTVARA